MAGSIPRPSFRKRCGTTKFLLLQQKIISIHGTQADPQYEILLRLKEEEEGLLPPGGFFPIAERFGMMEKLDRWVVSALITFVLGKKRTDPQWRTPFYCVNLSAAALLNPEFPEFVAKQLTERKFNGGSLCFEIAEPDVIAQRTEVYGLMAKLKPLGCRFTVDAFGSVKVSFAPLEGLAFDYIKIDGVIVQNLRKDPAQMVKAHALTKVCRKLGIHTIAEFVENQETLELLRAMGVEYVQGFGIGAPEPLGSEAEAVAAVGESALHA